MLDRNEQRIVGVLVEAGLLRPAGGLLAEPELRRGCNQIDSRDPMMDLTMAEVTDALRSLVQTGWVEGVESAAGNVRYRHRVAERFALEPVELALLCELLLCGPQTASVLGDRLERLGLCASGEVLALALEGLAARSQPLCVPLVPGPRGGERAWAHRLSHRLPDRAAYLRPVSPSAAPSGNAAAEGGIATAASTGAGPGHAIELEGRVEVLEQTVARLEGELKRLQTARLDDFVIGR